LNRLIFGMIEGVFYLLNDSEGVMNLGAINGSIVVIGLILGCIMMGSPWVVFVDPVSVFVVGAGSTAVLLAAHGTTGLSTIVRAVECWLSGSTSEWSSDELAHAARLAQTGGKAAMLTGWVGFMIGATQILQYLDPNDLTALGPACAVMVLTVLYGLCLKLVVWLPLESWLMEQALRVREEA
jgi:flagellar motor component MotA